MVSSKILSKYRKVTNNVMVPLHSVKKSIINQDCSKKHFVNTNTDMLISCQIIYNIYDSF